MLRIHKGGIRVESTVAITATTLEDGTWATSSRANRIPVRRRPRRFGRGGVARQLTAGGDRAEVFCRTHPGSPARSPFARPLRGAAPFRADAPVGGKSPGIRPRNPAILPFG
jgi:hypothetical protein